MTSELRDDVAHGPMLIRRLSGGPRQAWALSITLPGVEGGGRVVVRTSPKGQGGFKVRHIAWSSDDDE